MCMCVCVCVCACVCVCVCTPVLCTRYMYGSSVYVQVQNFIHKFYGVKYKHSKPW